MFFSKLGLGLFLARFFAETNLSFGANNYDYTKKQLWLHVKPAGNEKEQIMMAQTKIDIIVFQYLTKPPGLISQDNYVSVSSSLWN